MKPSRVWPCIAALVLLSPTALALPTLEAAGFEIVGSTEITGDAAAILALPGAMPFRLDVIASSAELTRLTSTYTRVDGPLWPEGIFQTQPDWTTDHESFGAISLTVTDVLPDGAALVAGATQSVHAASDGIVRIRAVEDPHITQTGDPSSARTEGADPGTIELELPGEYLLVEFSEGDITLAGDITLTFYGPAYTLTAGGNVREEQTGEVITRSSPAHTEGRQERHEYQLTGATIRLRSDAPIALYTQFPRIDFDGTLRAANADGSITLEGRDVPADGAFSWRGAGTLDLTAVNGLVAASTPDAGITTASARLAQGPSLGVIGAGLAVLTLLATAAVVLWRRRARPDDLELALLAMEERRWEDALPHLDRLARKQPHDTSVLVDRALCLEQTGRFREAANAFESALRAAPDQAEAHFYYARTLAKMRETEAARVHLETALERDPRLVELVRAETTLRGL